MDENQRVYFHGLTLKQQLTFLEDTWGVKVSVSLDLVYTPARRPVLVASARVLDAIHAAELGNPPPVVLTTRLVRSTRVDRLLGDCLLFWVRAVEEHNAAQSA